MIAQSRRAWRILRHDGHQSRAWPRKASSARTVVLVPDPRMAPIPATAALLGFTVESIPATEEGSVDPDALKAKLGPDVAAIMLTNPNTCGLFEREIVRHRRRRA